MSTLLPHTRNVTMWQAKPGAGRVPEPSTAAVEALPALLALLRAMGDEPSPCADDPRWTSDDDAELSAAVVGCESCPVLSECEQYAQALQPVAGVWAGRRWVGSCTTPGRAVELTDTGAVKRRRSA